MPFLPADLAARLRSGLRSGEAAIACTEAGSAIPVLGLWPLAALATVEAFLKGGTNLAVHAALGRVTWRPVVFPAAELIDIDDRESLVEAEGRLAATIEAGGPIPGDCDFGAPR
jgi:molybdopterin-guanine dinucleotide biosynthesis protein A